MAELPKDESLACSAFCFIGRRNGRFMLIKVMYQNNESDMVKPFLLDDLVASGKITKFFRSGGWVTIGVDPVRGNGGGYYKGPERRKNSLLELWRWCREEFGTRVR
jgi:hypothetical protein